MSKQDLKHARTYIRKMRERERESTKGQERSVAKHVNRHIMIKP
jgi:uncharacterized LabA/DUF88 family protein